MSDAAYAAGFADAAVRAHMTRIFSRMFGVTPSELRRCTLLVALTGIAEIAVQ